MPNDTESNVESPSGSSRIITQLGLDNGEMPPLPPGVALDPAPAQGACPWLDEYIAFSRRWSPRAFDDFHVSAGIWVLSTVAARRVMLHMGGQRFCCLYVALVARTSLSAKSTTASIGVAVLRQAGFAPLPAPDDATPQAFIRAMTLELPPNWEQFTSEQQATQPSGFPLPAPFGQVGRVQSFTS